MKAVEQIGSRSLFTWLRNFFAFMGSDSSLPCSQQPAFLGFAEFHQANEAVTDSFQILFHSSFINHPLIIHYIFAVFTASLNNQRRKLPDSAPHSPEMFPQHPFNSCVTQEPLDSSAGIVTWPRAGWRGYITGRNAVCSELTPTLLSSEYHEPFPRARGWHFTSSVEEFTHFLTRVHGMILN
jgi:hypothetical protein